MTTIRFMEASASISLLPTSIVKPSAALFDNFISIISWGRIIGKLNTVIKVALPLALDAIAEIMVKLAANPILPNPNITRK